MSNLTKANYINKIFKADSRNLLNVLGPVKPFVDTVVTSPPYWEMKDYGEINQIGFRQTKEDYLDDVRRVLFNCFQLTKSTGSLWLVVNDYIKDGIVQMLPWEVAECAKEAGWHLKDLIIWNKQHALPWQAKGRMRNVSEFIFFCTKTKTTNFKYYVDRVKKIDEISRWWIDFPERFNPKGITPTNIWDIPVRTQGTWRRHSKIEHHCPFPTALVARILEISTDPEDIVMDPFAGSGVVLAQADAMDRQFVGFEINDTYIQMFNDTVRHEVKQEWHAIQAWREKQNMMGQDFEQTILRLRALKFTRHVTRSFLDAMKGKEAKSIKAVICHAEIPKTYSRSTVSKLKIDVLVTCQPSVYKDALVLALKRAKQSPLSLYSIECEINVVSDLDETTQQLEDTYYLYSSYKPRSYKALNSLKDWLEPTAMDDYLEKGKVPMLANVAVDVAWAISD